MALRECRTLTGELGLLFDENACTLARSSPPEAFLSELGQSTGESPLFQFAWPEYLETKTYIDNARRARKFEPIEKENRLFSLEMLYDSIKRATEGRDDPIWAPRILRPDRTVFYRAKTSEFKAGDNLIYNVVFLTHSLRLYNDKALSSEAIRAMRKILYETMHLQREQHKGSKSFEVVLSMLEPELYKGNRPLIHCYIFNVETEEISWPEGVNIWSDRFLGFTGYTVDRFVDIENTLTRQMWLHRRNFPIGKVRRVDYKAILVMLCADNLANSIRRSSKLRFAPKEIGDVISSLKTIRDLDNEGSDSEFITDPNLIYGLSLVMHALSMLDLHRGAGDLCTTREDITINRAFQETSSNVLFHIINIALLNRALPLSRYLRRTIGGTHCTTLPLSSKLFVQINKRCSLNVVVCSIIIAGNVAFIAIPIYGENGEPNKAPNAFSLVSLCFSLSSIIASQFLSQIVNNADAENSSDSLAFFMQRSQNFFFTGTDGLALQCSLPEGFTLWSVIFIFIAVLVLMMDTSIPVPWERKMYKGTITICALTMFWLLATYMYTWAEMGRLITSVFHRNSHKKNLATATPISKPPASGAHSTPLPLFRVQDASS